MIKPFWMASTLQMRFGARTGFHITWVSQFCSVVGLDYIDGLLAGCDFIGLIMYVFARASILQVATEGRFQRIHWIPYKIGTPRSMGRIGKGILQIGMDGSGSSIQPYVLMVTMNIHQSSQNYQLLRADGSISTCRFLSQPYAASQLFARRQECKRRCMTILKAGYPNQIYHLAGARRFLRKIPVDRILEVFRNLMTIHIHTPSCSTVFHRCYVR